MKARLRELLVEQRFAEIGELAAERRRALGILVSLTFDPDQERFAGNDAANEMLSKPILAPRRR